MVPIAAAATVPAWLAAVIVGLTTLGAFVNAVSGAIGALVQLRRLEALDRQRTEREVAQHQELLTAINTTTVPEEKRST